MTGYIKRGSPTFGRMREGKIIFANDVDQLITAVYRLQLSANSDYCLETENKHNRLFFSTREHSIYGNSLNVEKDIKNLFVKDKEQG